MFREEHFTDTFQKKGWTKTEIEHALRILRTAENKKTYFTQALERHTLWFGLGKSLLANTTAAIVTLPLLLYLTPYTLYAILALIALSFGLTFRTLMKDLHCLESRHYTSSVLFILITLFLQFNALLHLTRPFANALDIALPYNPFLLMLSYAIPYLAPYTILILEEQKWI